MSITIDLNDTLAQQAEQYARQHEQSLVGLVEDYLRKVVQEPAKPLAPAVQELYGILSLPADFDY
jgi:flagellar biosynthesis/type III secretory pathway protein FliH